MLSTDQKFNISFDSTDATSHQTVSLEASQGVCLYDLAFTIYVDCFCNQEITSEKIVCKVKTPNFHKDFTMPVCKSIEETVISLADHIKL